MTDHPEQQLAGEMLAELRRPRTKVADGASTPLAPPEMASARRTKALDENHTDNSGAAAAGD